MGDPTNQTVAGRFKTKTDPCELVATFKWSGGTCGPTPEGVCGGVGLAAFREFGPPVGC
jgi:hypothetical protein